LTFGLGFGAIAGIGIGGPGVAVAGRSTIVSPNLGQRAISRLLLPWVGWWCSAAWFGNLLGRWRRVPRSARPTNSWKPGSRPPCSGKRFGHSGLIICSIKKNGARAACSAAEGAGVERGHDGRKRAHALRWIAWRRCSDPGCGRGGVMIRCRTCCCRRAPMFPGFLPEPILVGGCSENMVCYAIWRFRDRI